MSLGQELEPVTRHMAILAALLGCQGIDAFREELPDALNARSYPCNGQRDRLSGRGLSGNRPGAALPGSRKRDSNAARRIPSLGGQATTTMENRLEKGAQAQADIFGPQMLEAWKAGHINRWLAANCFGDYYTRTGLTLPQREMITFCFLAAQGGCEPPADKPRQGEYEFRQR